MNWVKSKRFQLILAITTLGLLLILDISLAGEQDLIFQNGFEIYLEPVPEVEFEGNQEYRILASNDLGMHCADLDYQVFSILPPFNVVHAQVIQKGATPILITPDINPNISIVYSAVSNPNDPIFDENNPTMPASLNPPLPAYVGTNRAAVSINSSSQNEDVYNFLKGNFWENNPQSNNPIGFDNYDNIFFGLLDPLQFLADIGLPVPESILLPDCLFNPLTCHFKQQIMPGKSNPFFANTPQYFNRFDSEVNFFSSVLPGPLGNVIESTNWWSADGIPILPIDDSGRTNPYPLMRVQALSSIGVLASADIVLPVAAESDCQNCHAIAEDCADINVSPLLQSNGCNESAISPTQYSNSLFDVMSLAQAPGITIDQRLVNAAKTNILRLHDVKHGTNYPTDWGNCDAIDDVNNSANWNANCLTKRIPIQCSQCHYSPALDLAQLGPTDDVTNQVFQATVFSSMSSVMHGYHSQFTELFPEMPAPDDPIKFELAIDNGFPDAEPTQVVAEYVIQHSCYQCHPGKRTQCLRGAMGNGSVTCHDCHGEMAEIGHDFTTGGTRVPWASEPKCQSCHTGDDENKNHPANAIIAEDGIRLLQAYVNDANSPIESATSRFAENESLYRLSGNAVTLGENQGHKGIMCKGCHGSTHAIWPTADPNSNDNITSNQLQGHSGTITECSTCHTADLGLTLDGPHGLHEISPISQNNGEMDLGAVITTFNRDHEELNSSVNCKSCHGTDGLGTVLSVTKADRTLACKEEGENGCTEVNVNGQNVKRVFVAQGTQVSCILCHENKIDED